MRAGRLDKSVRFRVCSNYEADVAGKRGDPKNSCGGYKKFNYTIRENDGRVEISEQADKVLEVGMIKVADMARTLQDMARQGGGTLDLETGASATLESGYYVGGANGIAAVVVAATDDVQDALYGAVAVMRERLGGRGFMGVWEHAGALYIDATDWHAEEWDAMEAGRARGEIAVWDIAKAVELTC